MTTDICSIWAYEEIISSGYLGDKQSKVLKIFSENYPKEYTASEIVAKLGRGLSETTRNRITELCHMGFLRKKRKVYCSIAMQRGIKRLVNSFQYTGRKYPFPKIETEIECPKCGGTGKIKKEIYCQDQE